MFTLIIYKSGLDISKITDTKVSLNITNSLLQTSERTVTLLKNNEVIIPYSGDNCKGLGEGFLSD